MKSFKFSLLVLLMTGILPGVNAYYIIIRTGGGPSGFNLITENHEKKNLNGNEMCVASLFCSGVGYEKPEFIGPFSPCEIQDTLLMTSNEAKAAGTFSEELNYVCLAAEKAIKGGSPKGKIKINDQKLIVYSAKISGYELTVYSKAEAIQLGLWN